MYAQLGKLWNLRVCNFSVSLNNEPEYDAHNSSDTEYFMITRTIGLQVFDKYPGLYLFWSM